MTATRSRTAIKSAKQNQGKKMKERERDGKMENECECGQTQGEERGDREVGTK